LGGGTKPCSEKWTVGCIVYNENAAGVTPLECCKLVGGTGVFKVGGGEERHRETDLNKHERGRMVKPLGTVYGQRSVEKCKQKKGEKEEERGEGGLNFVETKTVKCSGDRRPLCLPWRS